MKKTYILLSLLLALAFSACSRQMDLVPEHTTPADDRTLTLTTIAPDWDTESRALLSETDGSLSLTSSFRADDKVRLFITQDAKLYDLGDVPFADISEDGAVAKLSVALPEGVDVTKPIDLIGYNGINQRYITVSGTQANISISAFMYSSMEKFNAPVYFRMKGFVPSQDAITMMKVKFQHLGAYEVVHFTNKSTNTIKGRVTLSEVNGYGPKKGWAYMDGYKYGSGSVYYQYDLISGEISEVTERVSHDYYVEPDIPAGKTASIISWVYPRENVTLPTTVIDFYNTTGTTRNLQSKGMIPTKKFGMEVGKVYHVYGYWDGQQVVALDPETDSERPTCFVTFTTNKEKGSTLKFKSYVSYMSCSTAWVDYNNNGIKDNVTENAPTNFRETQITIDSQTFTFHGGFESIEMAKQGITSVEISPVASVTQLDLRDNDLSTEALNKLFQQLPDISSIPVSTLSPKTLKITGNPGTDDCNPKVAIQKGWILDVTIIDDTQPYTQISLSTYGSKDLYFYIDADPADQGSVWADLNGDGEKGDGESIEKFGDAYLLKYTALNKDVVFYGNITKLNFISASIFAYYGGTNERLTYLNLANTGVVAAITQGHPNLEYLNLNGNQLYTDVVALHVATLTKLQILDIGNCQTGDIDFSHNTELKYLNVEGNNMNTLDLSAQSHLTQLICSSNNLKHIDISKATGLFHLEIVQNAFTTDELNSIIRALPDRSETSSGGLWLANNPGTGAANLSMVKSRNWTIDARNSKADNKVRRPRMEGEDW